MALRDVFRVERLTSVPVQTCPFVSQLEQVVHYHNASFLWLRSEPVLMHFKLFFQVPDSAISIGIGIGLNVALTASYRHVYGSLIVHAHNCIAQCITALNRFLRLLLRIALCIVPFTRQTYSLVRIVGIL